MPIDGSTQEVSDDVYQRLRQAINSGKTVYIYEEEKSGENIYRNVYPLLKLNSSDNEKRIKYRILGDTVIYHKTISGNTPHTVTSTKLALGTTSGDGTMFLADDGSYKSLEVTEAPSDGKTYGRKNKQWSEIIASNQYLDIIAILPSEGNTLSDENYQKVVDAWENGIALARMNNTYVPIVIEKGEGVYRIYINTFMPNPNGLTVGVGTLLINTDKTHTAEGGYVDMHNNGDGTKYLSDNGQYLTPPIATPHHSGVYVGGGQEEGG